MGRFVQMLYYAGKDSKALSTQSASGKSRLSIFVDIVYCFIRYRIRSNQYVSNRLYCIDKETRLKICNQLESINRKQELWFADWYKERRFNRKYSDIKYDTTFNLRKKREMAYRKRYNIGEGLDIQYNVDISKSHFLDGELRIGNSCFIGKNVVIDYSGKLHIGDNVRITNGVIIETHHHAYHSDYTQPRNIVSATNLVIADGAVLGSRSIILPSCHYIGKNARVGAGAVVTKDVPDFAIVAGVPAKVIRTQIEE